MTRFFRLSRPVLAFSLALTIMVGAAGCGSGGAASSGSAPGPGGNRLTVFAAASLTEAFTALGRDFERGHRGVKVTFNFGSSATLAQQIVEGAPADVFAAASPATMTVVTGAHLAARPAVFARNTLQIAVPADNPAKIENLRHLAGPGVKLAVCAVQVPCGAAAAKALDAAGVKVTPATYERDVRATLTKVSLGEADAALVYRTDVLASGGKVRGIDFPEAAQAVNDYPIAALSTAPSARLAEQFVALVLSPQGARVLAEAGFQAGTG